MSPELDDRLASIIVCAMRKRPYNRYPSVDRMLADLEMARGGLSLRLFAEREVEGDVYEPQGPIATGALPQLAKLLALRERA